MTYNTIKARLFFEIYYTNNVSLLGCKTQKENEEKWTEILEIYSKKVNKDFDKILKITSKIRELELKYARVEYLILLLKNKKDTELINIIHNYGYTLRDDCFYEDLDKIQQNLNSIKIRIDKFSADLERYTNTQNENKEFDLSQSVLFMGKITEMGYIPTDKILLTEYVSLIKLTEKTIENIEKMK